jgi:hypothetical protein
MLVDGAWVPDARWAAGRTWVLETGARWVAAKWDSGETVAGRVTRAITSGGAAKTGISVRTGIGTAMQTIVNTEATRAADVRGAQTDTSDHPNSCRTETVAMSVGNGLVARQQARSYCIRVKASITIQSAEKSYSEVKDHERSVRTRYLASRNL